MAKSDNSVSSSEQKVVTRSESYSILNSLALDDAEKTYFGSIFEKYDRDNNGTIDAKELAAMLREDTEVSDKIVKKLIKYSDKNQDGKIDVNEFTDMMLDRKFKELFGHYVRSYVDFVVPQDKRRKFKPIGRSATSIDQQFESEVDGAYEAGYSCCPPPVCMILVSIIEIICFTLNQHLQRERSEIVDDVNGPVAQHLIYNPEKRQECWRFLTYMFVHIGWLHLTMNLIVQVMLGIALELRNRWWRILTVYSAGVIAGSLITSVTDPTVYLAGASGGVYAIITAHLANIVINWNEMEYPSLHLAVFIILIIGDVASAIYQRHRGDETPIGYAAHVGGAVAGFLVGIWVLKNVEPTEKEKYLWWAAFVVYMLLMSSAIILNIFWTDHFLPTK